MTTTKSLITTIGLAAWLFANVHSASADTVALTVAGGTAATHFNPSDLGGWLFTVNSPIDVTALGMASDFESQSHFVGIYDTSGNLLVSETVSPGSGTAPGGGLPFAYTPLGSSYLLAAGNYFIAEWYPGINADDFWIKTGSPTTVSQITYGGPGIYTGVFNPNQNQNPNSFVDGSTLANNGNAFFGPNFEFSTAAPTPEPATMSLIGLGLAGLGVLRRKRG